jgi:hypothetical protein
MAHVLLPFRRPALGTTHHSMCVMDEVREEAYGIRELCFSNAYVYSIHTNTGGG